MAAPARPLDTHFQLRLPEAAPRPILVPDPPPLKPGQRDDVARLRASLEGRIAAKVMNATELIRAVENRSRDEFLPTTLRPLDTLLGGGLPRGKAIEIAGRRSAGRFSIVLSALAAATSIGEAAALIDLADNFDPQIGLANGIDLARVLWIRPRTLKQAVMAAEMIAATGFQLVVVDAGSHPIRGRRVPDASWVRLARTAEANGTAMMISTPYPLTGTATEAVVSAHTAHAKWLGRGKSPRILAGTTVAITLEKHRHLRPGRSETLAFRTEDAVLVEQCAVGSGQCAAEPVAQTLLSVPAQARVPVPQPRNGSRSSEPGEGRASRAYPLRTQDSGLRTSTGLSTASDARTSAVRGLRSAVPS
jgi:recA bacterial DNA recombination protein